MTDESRKRAEERAHEELSPSDDPQDRLMYELKVHQIELEMQNAELLESHQDLQRARVQYESLFEHAPIPYFVFNTEGGILEVNHGGAALLRTERKYLEKKPFVVFLAREFHTRFFSHLRRVFELGYRQSVELQISTRDGNQIWARLESRNQQSETGEPRCLTAVLDITDQKRIEDDLILARESAVNANRAKSAFLANMSHEIRTPMSGIIAMTDVVLQTPLTEEQQGYISVIQSSARSLLSVVNDVLDVSRVEADHITLERKPFPLRDVVTTVQAMFQPNAAQKEIDLIVEMPPSISAVLRGDRNRLRQILVNLVSNAIHHTDRGSVTLRVSEQELSDFLREVTFEVADTGRGISPAEQRRIYDVFNRADTETRRFEGSGLGLSISRRLATLMGGQLYFESSPDAGSRFFFSLPLEVSSEEELPTSDEPSSAPPVAAHGGRILVAEDNPINILVIRTVLEKAGFEVHSVGSGEEVIPMLERMPFDLVLMDISMPGMDGITAAGEIRRRESSDRFNRDVPIVAISAHSMKGDRERFLEAGMNDYISKPFVRETILEVINRTIADAQDVSG